MNLVPTPKEREVLLRLKCLADETLDPRLLDDVEREVVQRMISLRMIVRAVRWHYEITELGLEALSAGKAD